MSKFLFIQAGGRKRRIFRRQEGGNWHIRIERKRKDHLYSLGTTLDHIAKEKAKKKIEDVINEDFLSLERSKQRTGYSTLPEILSRYNPPPDEVAPYIAANNVSQMRLLVRVGGSNMDPDTATAAVFADDQLVKRYQHKRMTDAQGADMAVRHRTAISVNSTVRQARSILSKKHMHLYRGLKLPDLTEFREARPLKVHADYSFVPFSPGIIERIDAEISSQERNVQIAAILMRYAGLRNSEVEFAKWEWFRRRPDGTATLSIELRPYFKVKNQSVRTLQLNAGLVSKLRPFWGRDDDWVIDAADREFATHKALNDWLRHIIPDRTKCAYELRKHAGSEILTREGGPFALVKAARFLGDTIQTTEKHYARFLGSVDNIGPSSHLQVVKVA